MEEFIDFFADIPKIFRSSILIGGIVFFWILEGIVPFYKKQYNRSKHAFVNIIFTLTSVLVVFVFASLLLWTSNFTSENKIGLLFLVEMPLWLQVIAGILLLDSIGAYAVHFVVHKVKWMWGFHVIHHSDLNVDVTSGLRHHPGEMIFRMTFTIMAVLITGAPMGIIMLYQSLSALFTHFTHANVSAFGPLDKPLSYIFVTPNMHKVHHHYKLPWTDTNFGNIFSFWDRIFGTFEYVDDMSQIKYGIDTHMDPKENENIGNLMKIPFQKYRSPEDL
ncbi:MAG: sterol desaturase family protein [Reichenbachiella sp.]